MSWMCPRWDFGVAILLGGACTPTRRMLGAQCLPNGQFWAHLLDYVFYSVSELGRACFRQVRVAQAVLVLPPSAWFHAETFALPPCAPKSPPVPAPIFGGFPGWKMSRIVVTYRRGIGFGVEGVAGRDFFLPSPCNRPPGFSLILLFFDPEASAGHPAAHPQRYRTLEFFFGLPLFPQTLLLVHILSLSCFLLHVASLPFPFALEDFEINSPELLRCSPKNVMLQRRCFSLFFVESVWRK